MKLSHIPFVTTDRAALPREEKSAQAGQTLWHTQQFGDIRVRKVECTPGYVSDHWCTKGHVLLRPSDELHPELQDGRQFTLKPGTSYQVADNAKALQHTASHKGTGGTLFVMR